MKRFAFTLIACFACFQAVQADSPTVTSPVNLSLMHYEAVIANLSSNPDFQNIISEGEFITDMRIQRRGFNANQGNVYVNITTRLPAKSDDVVAQEETLCESKGQSKSSCHRRNGRCKHKGSRISKTYRATLAVTPVDGGTPSITVVSIEPLFKIEKLNDNESNLMTVETAQ